ncbi:hypothetical protein KUCAC02_010568, partial [Chaenocephalus aceratus]
RMFPAMRVKIAGLDPHQQYYIAMDIVAVDNKRYRKSLSWLENIPQAFENRAEAVAAWCGSQERLIGTALIKSAFITRFHVDSPPYVYHSSKWMVAGNADSPVPPRAYIHPDSLASETPGRDRWSASTNSNSPTTSWTTGTHPPRAAVTLSSRLFPPPVFSARPSRDSSMTPLGRKQRRGGRGRFSHSLINQEQTEAPRRGWGRLTPRSAEGLQQRAVSEQAGAERGGVKTFSFPETVFTTVTAYQNQQTKDRPQPVLPKASETSGRNRTGLEAIMETYAFWRPPVRTLTFEDFTNMQKQQGGSTGTSPTTSSTGTPSPSGAAHLLSPSCSPPTFHLAPNTFNVGCRESQLCNLGLSEYPACARSNMAALQGYGGLADSSYGRLQAAGGAVASGQPSESFLPQRTSSLIAAGMQGGPHASLSGGGGGGSGGKMDAYGGQLGSFPASQLQYVMQAGGGSGSAPSSSSGSSPSPHMFSGSHHHVQQGSYNAFSLHNPYNLYGYNFPTSPRLAASPEKPQGGLLCSSSSAGAFAERQYLSNGSMDTMHMIGNNSGGQQGGSSCDGRQYGSSSQMSMHMV